MSDEQKLYPWKTGLPTKPDVDLIMKRWPDLKPGDRISYEEIEDCIGLSKNKNPTRFTTITESWKKRMEKEKDTPIFCERNVGFFAAKAKDGLSKTPGILISVGKKVHGHRKILAMLAPETDQDRSEIEHQGRLLHEAERSLRKTKMNILPNTKTEQIPQITKKQNGETN